MIRKRTQLILGMVLGLAVAVSAAPKVTVVVRPASDVSAESVTLGEIASIDGVDDAQADRLKSVPVCPSPLPGKSRKLTDDQIMTALKRAGLFETTGLLCPPEIAVVRTSAVVGSADLLETVREYVLSTNTWSGTVTVEPAIAPADQTVPTGALDLRVKAGRIAVRKGRNSIPVEIVIGDKVYRTVQVSVNVRLIVSVPVASKAIARSEAISSANVIMKERDVTTLPDDILTAMPEADWTASLPISEGSILRKSWVSSPPAVLSGDPVLVVVSSGSVRVAEKGVAAQEGRVGDTIKVRLSGERREIRGTVSGPGLVEISIGRRNH